MYTSFGECITEEFIFTCYSSKEYYEFSELNNKLRIDLIDKINKSINVMIPNY